MNLKLGKKMITAILLVIVTASLISAAFLYLNNQDHQSSDIESITIAVPPLEQNALLYVAANQGFFIKNHVNVSIKNYDSGVTSINGLLSGEVQIAEAAEFPFVNAVCKNYSLSVIGVNDKFENDYIVGLQGHGIENISDLKGKTIGVAKGTIAEFYLGRFLDLNAISLEQVHVVDIRPNDYVEAVANGTVDALVAWQPYINQIQNGVNKIATWEVQSGQEAFGVLVCSNDWLIQHPNTVEHYLKALNEAQKYALNHPDGAKEIVENKLNYSESYVASVWHNHTFGLSLDQALVIAMKDETQWIINNNLTNATTVPNFIDYIYFDGLLAVDPTAVTIIR